METLRDDPFRVAPPGQAPCDREISEADWEYYREMYIDHLISNDPYLPLEILLNDVPDALRNDWSDFVQAIADQDAMEIGHLITKAIRRCAERLADNPHGQTQIARLIDRYREDE